MSSLVTSNHRTLDPIIVHTAATFDTAVSKGDDLEKLFHTTLASLGKYSDKTARQTKDSSAGQAGIRRDREDQFNPNMISYLHESHQEYNDQLLKKLQHHLSKMKHTPKKFEQTELTVPEEKCLGRASSTEFSIISAENVNERLFQFSFENYQRIYTLCNGSPPPQSLKKETFTTEYFNKLLLNKEAMEKLKKAAPQEYKKIKLSAVIGQIRRDLPDWRKSDWALVTRRSEVDGKMYAFSQYLTWLNRNFIEDPVEHMTGHSTITIFHQDPFLIEPMLRDVAKVFKEALEWDGKDVKTLKERVALFRYELGHAMPFAQKNDVIYRQFERAIYYYHGYDITYNEKKPINLEVLTSSLPDFVKNYTKNSFCCRDEECMIQLELIENID